MYDIFDKMADKWPSFVVARRAIEDFSGGAIKPKHLANLDSLGEGPPERILIGGHISYPIESFIPWLRARSQRKG